MAKLNHGAPPFPSSRPVAVNTFAYSCATPIAATFDTPPAAACSRYGPITSILRSPLPKPTTGISLSLANLATARRNRPPIWSKIAGEGIGNPRCAVKNDTTCPPTCRFGT